MNFIEIILGLVGLLVWLFFLYCLFYHKIQIDRILSRGKYSHIFVVLVLIFLWLYGVTFVAYMNNVEPWDLLYYNNLYGRGTDLESKLQYRLSIADRVAEESEDPSLFGTVFYHFRGFGTEYNAGTPTGRMWAFFISLSGILVLGGLLLPCVLSVITRRTAAYQSGEQRYNIQRSPYAVIFGAHETVPNLIKRILSDKHDKKLKYVILHTSENVAAYRRDIESRLSPSEINSLILYQGSRTNPSEIDSLYIERAKEVYVLGEKVGRESETDHDSMNMECVRLIASKLKDKQRNDLLKCYALFEYHTTYTSFLYSDLSKLVKEQVEFIYMNYYVHWAQKVLTYPQTNDVNKINYLPLEGDAIMDGTSDKTVHLVIIGMTRMGMAMAIEAAQNAHYPNFCTKGKRTKITFIDQNIDAEMRLFMARYPDYFSLCRWRRIDIERDDPMDVAWQDPLNNAAKMKREGKKIPFDKFPYAHLADPTAEDANFIDCEWEFVKGNVDTHAAKEYLVEHATNEKELLSVCIAVNYAPTAISIGMYLPREVYRDAIQVFVAQKQSADIIRNISGVGLSKDAKERMRYNKLRPFGMLTDCFTDYIVDNRLAKLINFVYNCKQDTQLKCADEIDPKYGIPQMDVYWRDTLVCNQWSSKCSANSITTKLRFLDIDVRETPISAINSKIRQPDVLEMLAQVEHNRWNTEKLLLGFRPLNDREIAPLLELLENGNDSKQFYEEKNRLKKGWEMAHLNICSYEMLKKYDKPAIEYDIVVTKALPAIVEWMRDSL